MIAKAATILALLAYPALVYIGLSRFDTRTLGLVLLTVIIVSSLPKLRRLRRADLLALFVTPLCAGSVILVAVILDNRVLLLLVPALINAVLLSTFALSMRNTPMVERFARLTRPDLPIEQVHYCRNVTKAWCAFFIVNAATAATMALAAPLEWWTLYNGIIAYVLIGSLFTAEYILRKYRFREYQSGLHDRFLAHLFPPHGSR